MRKDKPEEVIKKLDKVADSLENTSSQLSSVVTQQQMDLLRERLAKCEADIKNFADTIFLVSEKYAKRLSETSDRHDKTESILALIDRDHSAMRALIYSSFVLSTISIISLVIFSIQV